MKANVDGLFVYLPSRQDRSQPFTLQSWLGQGEVTFCFKIHFGSGFCSIELRLVYF